MNWDRLLEEIRRKARQGDKTCVEFLELFEDLPLELREKAMKCAIEINFYYGKWGEISERKILEIGKKWGVQDLLEDEVFALQIEEFLPKDSEPGEPA